MLKTTTTHGAVLNDELVSNGWYLAHRCGSIGLDYMRVYRAAARENCTESSLRDIAACAGISFGELAERMDERRRRKNPVETG